MLYIGVMPYWMMGGGNCGCDVFHLHAIRQIQFTIYFIYLIDTHGFCVCLMICEHKLWQCVKVQQIKLTRVVPDTRQPKDITNNGGRV